MFEKKERFDYALVFDFGGEEKLKASIHMICVFFPITAVYLDEEKRVVDIAELKPFVLNYTPRKKSRFLIELPPEHTDKIRLNDQLDW